MATYLFSYFSADENILGSSSVVSAAAAASSHVAACYGETSSVYSCHVTSVFAAPQCVSISQFARLLFLVKFQSHHLIFL